MSFKLYTHDGINCYYKQSMFPVGETYVRLLPEGFNFIASSEEFNIEWIFNGDQEVMELLLIVDTIRRVKKDVKLNLILPYMPGSRQDRVCEPGEAFNIRVYGNLLKSLNFNKIEVFDAHSDVTAAVLDDYNIKAVDNSELVRLAISREVINPGWDKIAKLGHQSIDKLITLISPDAGANKKIFKLAKQLPWKKIEVIRADKQRNTSTHEVNGTAVYGDVTNKTVFIVDDICSRGGTFKSLAKRLKEMKADKVILIVSHYEATANVTELQESGIDKIYCHNDFGYIDRANANEISKFVEKI